MRRLFSGKPILFIVVIGLAVVVMACGPKLRKPVSELDTPEHHSFTGLKLLDEAKYGEAEREFELALQLAPEFSRAHAGMALVKAYKGDFKAASESVKKAGKYAKTDDEKVFVHVGRIRILTLGRLDKDWLKEAKDEFDDAVKINPQSSAACYFMGIAYKTALEFDQAGQMFRRTLDLNKEYVKEADAEWNLTQKIQRAMPGTIIGKKIAILERITRADAAALFMEELKIDNLYKKRTIKTFDTSFKDPEKAKTGKESLAVPKDISDHPLKADIEGILKIGVRGLETYPDGSYHPADFVDRATYAMMIEDILIKVTGDNALATKFIGQVSPFPDLRSDLPYFNAVMVVTSRGIMETKDFTSGEFAPLGAVPGVDALLIIRKFKEELKFF
jgi:tetratricopeptide (TPR) repeat protein